MTRLADGQVALQPSERPIIISTSFGRVVHGRVYQGEAAAERSVVILGALAAPQRYLRSLSQWLAEQGYGVLTFDYRGIGESRAAGDPTTNLDDWAHDTAAAIAAARETFATRRLLVLGHSIGGMLLGHSGAAPQVDGALLIAATHGVPDLYHGRARLRIEAAYTLLPRIARVLGSLPGWSWLMGTKVPRDVILQWVRWGKTGSFEDWNGEPSVRSFAAFRGPLLAVKLADDPDAPCEAVDALLKLYVNAGARRDVLDPRDHGGEPLGHFGLFRADAPAWTRDLILRWLEELEAAT